MKSDSDKKGCYPMRLANGQGWEIVATKGTRAWVEKIASIMGLERRAPNGLPKLIFTKREPGRVQGKNPILGTDLELDKELPRRGWEARDFRELHLWSHGDTGDLICEMGPSQSHDQQIHRMWLSLFPVFRQAQGSGGLPFHTALVERDGHGILLAGRRAMGKSTCCRRLPSPWRPQCDNHALIVPDELKGYRVHPFPTWSDYLLRRGERTWNVQEHFPLSAIFFLLRADSDDVIPMGRGEATGQITRSATEAYHPNCLLGIAPEELRALRGKLFENACELTKSVPSFVLCVSGSGRFWEKMEEVLK
jgi:SynChlorMet cassette protein ScmC